MNQNTQAARQVGATMRSFGQILITFILCWAHFQFETTPLMVKTSSYSGVSPISERPLPLSADDIIRGLKANSEISFDETTLDTAYRLRQDFARHKSTRDALEVTLGEQTIQLIKTMEKKR